MGGEKGGIGGENGGWEKEGREKGDAREEEGWEGRRWVGIFYKELLKYSWCKWTRYLSSEFTYLQILEFRKITKEQNFERKFKMKTNLYKF